jgi:hypothetical protein
MTSETTASSEDNSSNPTTIDDIDSTTSSIRETKEATTCSEDNSSSPTTLDEIDSTVSFTSETSESTSIAEIFNETSTEFSTESATANTILEESNPVVKETKFVAYIVVGSIFAILIASIIIYFVIKISKRRPIDNMSVEMHNNFYKNSTYVDEI